jgi:hypothetical protein
MPNKATGRHIRLPLTRSLLLDNISRVVRLDVYLVTAGAPANLPKIADGASELLRGLFVEEECRRAW